MSDVKEWTRHAACAGCAINCYFEPSMGLTPTSGYFWESLPSKWRYVWTKVVVQRLSQKLGPKEAHLPDLTAYLATPSGDGATPPSTAPSGDGAAAPSDLIALPVLR